MRRIMLAATLWVALGSLPAHALPSPGAMDLFGTRALSMGNAFRSVASSNETLFHNPAGVALGQRYELDAAYGFSPGDRLSLFNLSVVDSKTARVAAGASYSYLAGEGDQGDVGANLGHLVLGFHMSPLVQLGVGLKYLGFSRPERTNSITADVGLLARPLRMVSLGLVAYNLIDVHSDQAPFQLGAGASIGSDTSFRLAFDTVADLGKERQGFHSYHAGGEYLFDHSFPVRVGFQRIIVENRNYLTLGLGLVSPRAGVEAGFAQNLRSKESEDRIFSFTLKLFL